MSAFDLDNATANESRESESNKTASLSESESSGAIARNQTPHCSRVHQPTAVDIVQEKAVTYSDVIVNKSKINKETAEISNNSSGANE